ncbi:MAG: hypothetical protein JRG86_00355 [Deltaproteobacteria bacterium]|nr:hypothetical protein [Deltaproteobacteria bacterium]MBW2497479.1 hypothetical protein [Deltaproteobacteria bacterium]
MDAVMTTGLALWQELLLLGLAMLSLVYVLYFRIWVALATGSDLLFITALALAATSIVFPRLYAAAACDLLEHTPVPAALASADERVAALEALPQELIARALERLGYDEALPETRPREPGPFETRVRPALENLIATILRVTSFLCAMLVLVLALALRSSTSTARELRALAQRLDRLEAPPAPPARNASA